MSAKFIILAGGTGSRLWPLSRRLYAKQFLTIANNRSFLQSTVSRLYPQIKADDIFVVTNIENKFIVYDQVLDIIPEFSESNILIEPHSLNSCFSVIFATRMFRPDDEIFVLPSDQFITNDEHFLSSLLESPHSENITIYGIDLMFFKRHYGYILPSKNDENGLYDVEDFIEKPRQEQLDVLAVAKFIVNSGIYFFKRKAFDRQLKKYFPQGYEIAMKLEQNISPDFECYPPLSIEKAIMEKSKNLKMRLLNVNLHDVVSFNDFDDILPSDAEQNYSVQPDSVVAINSHKNIIFNNEKQVVALGVNDLVIADTDDALLVAKTSHLSELKNALVVLKKKNPQLTEIHKTAYRPWGSYTILETHDNYKVKRLVINPGKKISLQYHKHRSETWTVVKGVAEVICGDDNLTLFQTDSVFIPTNTKHRLYNPLSRVSLIVIEVQTGDYLGEDDIIRIEDDFERV